MPDSCGLNRHMNRPIDTIIRCPNYGTETPAVIPDDSCVIGYECKAATQSFAPRTETAACSASTPRIGVHRGAGARPVSSSRTSSRS